MSESTNGPARLLQDGKEIGRGEYSMEANGRGEIKIDAPYGTRIRDYDPFVMEVGSDRYDLTTVRGVGYFDKSQREIDYHRGWHGVARTVITVKFAGAAKQKWWRPVLAKVEATT